MIVIYSGVDAVCNRDVLLLFITSHDMVLFPVVTYEYAKQRPHCTQIYCSIVTYACMCIYEHHLICNAALLV